MNENSDRGLQKTSINWYPGHMAKTKRQIEEDLKQIDVVIELLDARIPQASQNPEIQKIIKDKKRVIVLNKCDLADEIENKKWVSYFATKGIPSVLVDSNSGKGIREVIGAIETLMKREKEIATQKGRVGRATRVMVLGIPNVGKSSFINRMASKSSAQVGNKPGITRQKQWIRVNQDIALLDTPGVLWPKFENEQIAFHLAFTGTIKDDILDKTEIAYYLLKQLLKEYPEAIMQRYQLVREDVIKTLSNSNQMENENIMEIMYQIGKKRGAILAGGKIDEEKTACLLLDDFRTGKLGRLTLEKSEIAGGERKK